MNHQPKSKTSLVLLIIALVILAITGGYFIYAQGLLKSSKTEDINQVGETNNSADDSTTSTVNNESTTSGQTSRDPNRYYNDEGGYSFIVPEGYKIKPESEIPGYIEEPKFPYRFGLDTSFDYQYPNSDDPDSNPDIWVMISQEGQKFYNRARPENFANCKDGVINTLTVRECRYQDYLLGGNSIIIKIFSDNNKVFQLESHDDYNNAIQQIIKSFSWL